MNTEELQFILKNTDNKRVKRYFILNKDKNLDFCDLLCRDRFLVNLISEPILDFYNKELISRRDDIFYYCTITEMRVFDRFAPFVNIVRHKNSMLKSPIAEEIACKYPDILDIKYLSDAQIPLKSSTIIKYKLYTNFLGLSLTQEFNAELLDKICELYGENEVRKLIADLQYKRNRTVKFSEDALCKYYRLIPIKPLLVSYKIPKSVLKKIIADVLVDSELCNLFFHYQQIDLEYIKKYCPISHISTAITYQNSITDEFILKCMKLGYDLDWNMILNYGNISKFIKTMEYLLNKEKRNSVKSNIDSVIKRKLPLFNKRFLHENNLYDTRDFNSYQNILPVTDKTLFIA